MKFTPEEAVKYLISNYASKISIGAPVTGGVHIRFGFGGGNTHVVVQHGKIEPEKNKDLVEAFKALEGEQPLSIAAPNENLLETSHFCMSELGALALKQGLAIMRLQGSANFLDRGEGRQ